MNNHVKAILLFSGSLARKEPTYKIVKGNVELVSDLDFVIIYDEQLNSYETICRLVETVKGKFPFYDCSFDLIEKENTKKAKSFFKRDLRLNTNQPVYCGLKIDVSTWGESNIDTYNYIESIITQTCCYFLNPELTRDMSYNCFFKKVDYHKIKLILECFRGYVYACGNGIIGYNDLLLYKYCKDLPKIYTEEIVKKCLQCRECSMFQEIPDIDILNLMHVTFAKLFDSNNYCTEIASKLSIEKDPVKLFQYTTILLFMTVNEKNSWHDLYRQMDALKISFNRVSELRENLKNYINEKNEKNYERLMVAYRKIRNEYVQMLHERNTCEVSFTDYVIKNRN